MLRGEQTDTPPIGEIHNKLTSASKPTILNSVYNSHTSPCSWCGKSAKHDHQHCAANMQFVDTVGRKGTFNQYVEDTVRE